MKWLLGLLVGLVISDGLLTCFLVKNGLAREGNPFLVDIVGKDILVVLKVVGAIVCALILWDVYRRYPKLAVTCTLCFLAIYVLIVGWNLSLFFMVVMNQKLGIGIGLKPVQGLSNGWSIN